MYKEISKLIVYTNRNDDEILNGMSGLFKLYDSKTATAYELREKAFAIVKEILDLSTSCAFEDNLWQSYLTYYIITNENSFAVTCERKGAAEGSINDIVKSDFKVFMNLFDYDFTEIEEYLGTDCFTTLTNYKTIEKPKLMYNGDVSECVNTLRKKLADSKDTDEFFKNVSDFYRDYGAGIFGMNREFRITTMSSYSSPLRTWITSSSRIS